MKKNPAAVSLGRKSALTTLLMRLRTTTDLAEIRRFSDQIERVVFHKQFRNA
jgi:hypothetical protein